MKENFGKIHRKSKKSGYKKYNSGAIYPGKKYNLHLKRHCVYSVLHPKGVEQSEFFFWSTEKLR